MKIDLNHNNSLLEEENNRLSPLRDKKMESLAKLQKLNIDMSNLNEEETRIKGLQIKLQKSLETLNSDLEREKSISLDASLNEKRIFEEKNELLNTEKQLFETEDQFGEDLFTGPKFKKQKLTTKQKLIDPKDQTGIIHSSWGNLGNHILLLGFIGAIVFVILSSY